MKRSELLNKEKEQKADFENLSKRDKNSLTKIKIEHEGKVLDAEDEIKKLLLQKDYVLDETFISIHILLEEEKKSLEIVNKLIEEYV